MILRHAHMWARILVTLLILAALLWLAFAGRDGAHAMGAAASLSLEPSAPGIKRVIAALEAGRRLLCASVETSR